MVTDKLEKAVPLPEEQEILKRLMNSKIPKDDVVINIYREVAREGSGKKLVALGVVMLLALSVRKVLDGYPPQMENLFHVYVPEIIDLIVDDKEVAEEAKAFHARAMKSS